MERTRRSLIRNCWSAIHHRAFTVPSVWCVSLSRALGILNSQVVGSSGATRRYEYTYDATGLHEASPLYKESELQLGADADSS